MSVTICIQPGNSIKNYCPISFYCVKGKVFRKGSSCKSALSMRNRVIILKKPSKYGAATEQWILQQLHSKTVLAHIGAFPNKCTIQQPLHAMAT
jgi:hypothetical protein